MYERDLAGGRVQWCRVIQYLRDLPSLRVLALLDVLDQRDRLPLRWLLATQTSHCGDQHERDRPDHDVEHAALGLHWITSPVSASTMRRTVCLRPSTSTLTSGPSLTTRPSSARSVRHSTGCPCCKL